MARGKQTARAKRDNAPAPRVELVAESKGNAFPPGRMLISSPLEITHLIRAIPYGQVITVSELKQQMAQRNHADYACPLTTGIFLRMAAEAAYEENTQDAHAPETAWWRVIKDNARMLDKMPGGPDYQADKLKAEGHHISQRRGVDYLERKV